EVDLNAAARNDDRIVVAGDHRRRLQEEIRVVARVARLALPDPRRGHRGGSRGRRAPSGTTAARRWLRRAAAARLIGRNSLLMLDVVAAGVQLHRWHYRRPDP